MEHRDFNRSELYLLHAAVLQLDRIARELLRPLDLTYGDFLTLLMVHEHPGSPHRDIADALDLNKATVSLRVKALLERGWIEQRQNRENRREQLLELPAAGVARLLEAERVLSEAAEPLFSSLGRSREPFRRGLERLVSRLDAGPPAGHESLRR
jgi:DNA-binding MarR family transcriptional regulator